MKQLLTLVLVVALVLPAFAQEMTAPEPLDDDLMTYFVGEWEGWFEGPMGKSKDWVKYELGLDGQFLFIQASSDSPGMMYKGMGAITLNPQNGQIVGTWIDNFRGMYEGTGKREGNKLIIEWTGPTGKSTRITEKVGDNKFKVVAKMVGPDGSMTEYSGEFTRKKSEKKTD